MSFNCICTHCAVVVESILSVEIVSRESNKLHLKKKTKKDEEERAKKKGKKNRNDDKGDGGSAIHTVSHNGLKTKTSRLHKYFRDVWKNRNDIRRRVGERNERKRSREGERCTPAGTMNRHGRRRRWRWKQPSSNHVSARDV